jgi:hypothetical protein
MFWGTKGQKTGGFGIQKRAPLVLCSCSPFFKKTVETSCADFPFHRDVSEIRFLAFHQGATQELALSGGLQARKPRIHCKDPKKRIHLERR